MFSIAASCTPDDTPVPVLAPGMGKTKTGRKTNRYKPAQSVCPDCGGNLRLLGEDVSEMLEYVPAQFQVIRQVRPKLRCTSCERIVQPPAPSRLIERGLAGPGLLAHVLVSKYADHLPLYRQSEIYARHGVKLERSTLADLAERVTCSLGYGPMFVTTVQQGTQQLLRSGLLTRPISRANIRSSICETSAARCRPMSTQDSINSMKMTASGKLPVGRTCGASSGMLW